LVALLACSLLAGCAAPRGSVKNGWFVQGGTEGAGRYTTRTVVATSITILTGNFLLGKALLPFV
jgi:ABC-type transporter Mla maintaining outer membrane lipid asymmetry permease subunit MlaE